MGLISCMEVDKIYMKQLDFLVCHADNQPWFLPLLLLFCVIGSNTQQRPLLQLSRGRKLSTHLPVLLLTSDAMSCARSPLSVQHRVL